VGKSDGGGGEEEFRLEPGIYVRHDAGDYGMPSDEESSSGSEELEGGGDEEEAPMSWATADASQWPSLEMEKVSGREALAPYVHGGFHHRHPGMPKSVYKRNGKLKGADTDVGEDSPVGLSEDAFFDMS